LSKLTSLAQEVGRAQHLISNGENAEARSVLQRVLAEARRSGQASSYVLWSLAVASDNLEDHENSTRYIQEAIALDPLSPQLRRSFDIIANNVRQALLSEKRSEEDPEIPALYELLVRMSEADLDSHLRMANYHAAVGDPEASHALLDALSKVFPASPQVWELLAKVATLRDDAATVERCAKAQSRLTQPCLPTFKMERAEG
jgi:predicted Zn-dependent protease